MQKIDKSADKILSTKYKAWLEKTTVSHYANNRTYYDDVAMNLYSCQSGVCAYTEAYICIPELYDDVNWVNGRYRIPDEALYKRVDHRGEMDHFDPTDKKSNYWNWENLFMIDAKINSIKSDEPIVPYLKPDLADYSPEKYFNYDDETHRFIPNIDIEDPKMIAEIQNMIDKVLCLNHGVVRKDRQDYINVIKDKEKRGIEYIVDRFFTSVKWSL